MTHPPLRLTAASSSPALELRAALDTTDTTTRTLSGTIVPYGVVGYTSMGPSIFMAGSIRTPSDLSRVKLLVQHDTYRAGVGYMTELEDGEDRARASFHLPEGDTDSDEALMKAHNKLREGLSVGVRVHAYSFDEDDNLIVWDSSLDETSLVTIPAFDDARLDVAAARKELIPTMKTREELAAALAAGTISKAEHDRQLAALDAAAAPTPPAGASGGSDAAASITASRPEPEAPPVQVNASASAIDLRAASAITMEHLRSRQDLGALNAALQDVTSTTVGDSDGLARPAFIDQVWNASAVRRPLIDVIQRAALTALRVYGWAWVRGPEVVEYNGEKEPVPSNPWSTKTVDAEAQPFAGGWDVERKLIDLGAPGLIDTAYQKATDSYRLNSEAWVAAQLAAAATVVPASASLTAALATLGVRAATIGATIGFVQFGVEIWAEFVSLPEAEVPWWLRSQGSINLGTTDGTAGGLSFSVNPALGARDIIAGDSRSATFYEVEPPIRVRAENIPNGGVDLGVFGYGALIVNDERALFRTTVTAPAPAIMVMEAPTAPTDPATDQAAGTTPPAI